MKESGEALNLTTKCSHTTLYTRVIENQKEHCDDHPKTLTLSAIIGPNKLELKLELKAPDSGIVTMTRGLVDSGATNLFISDHERKRCHLELVPLKRTIPVYNVDGSPNEVGGVKSYVEAIISFNNHREKTRLYVANLGNTPLILGHTWLKFHNPNIDWKTGEVKMSRCPRSCGMNYREERKARTGSHVRVQEIEDESEEELRDARKNSKFLPNDDDACIRQAETGVAENDSELSDEEWSKKTGVPQDYVKWRKVFEAKGFDELPPERPWDHAIELKPGSKPYSATKCYPMTLEEQRVQAEFIEKNRRSGRIKTSKSEWAAPFFFTTKSDGTLRPIQDYRKLNEMTVKNKYPLPLISEIINRLRGSTLFTKMDIRWGFNNIRIRVEDQHKAAFLTNQGLFEPTVMFFGLTNSPATFQTMMNEILRELILSGDVIVYMDDILVYSNDEKRHVEVVKKVLTLLEENKLYLRPEKCEFSKRKLSYLGVIIGEGGISMDPKRIDAVSNWPTPKNKRDVQVFTGLCNFFRRFIKGFAEIARPLYALTKATSVWQWGRVQQDAFDSLKRAITSSPILVLPTDDGPFRVEADASEFASGAILSQKQNDQWKPVAFLSKSFDQAQRNYEIHDREMLAIMRALEEWRQFLQGAHHQVEIWSDHQNLEYFMSAKKLTRRQARWSQYLSQFDFILYHRPGSTMQKADSLSRRPDHRKGIEHDNEGVVLLKPERIRVLGGSYLETEGDKILEKLKDVEGLEKEAKEFVDEWKRDERGLEKRKKTKDGTEWEMTEGVVYRNGKAVVPSDNDLRRRIVELHHDSLASGHPGRYRTAESVRRYYWWPKMRPFINRYVDSCETCQRTKIFPTKPKGELQPLEIPNEPWETVGVDYITDLPPSKGHDSIMMVVDHFSKGLIAIPCNKTITAEGTARLFRDRVWANEGLPKKIVSDRGPQFVADFTKELFRILDIKGASSTAYHPQTDGQTERANQEIEQYFRIFVNYHQDDWSDWIPSAQFAYNSRVNASTNQSPFFITKGRHPNSGREPTRISVHTSASAFAKDMQKVREETKWALTLAKEDMKRFYDRSHSFEEFTEGEKVWLEASHVTSGRPKKKLDYKRYGPFTIKKKVSRTAYTLALPRSYFIHPTIHVSRLRRFVPDEFNRPPARRVRLRVRGEDWIPQKILDSRENQSYLEYLVRWKDQPETRNTWEMASRMDNECPELVNDFHKRRPNAPRRINRAFSELSKADLSSLCLFLLARVDARLGGGLV